MKSLGIFYGTTPSGELV